MAGLHREVHLEARAPVHLGDVRVDAGLTDDLRRGTLRVRATVTFTRPELIEPGWTVEAQLEALDGRAVGRPLAGAVPHVTAPYFFHGHVVDVATTVARRPTVVGRAARSLRASWSRCRNPDGEVVEVVRQVTGFRRVEVRDRQLLVNGRDRDDPGRQPPRPPPRAGQGRDRRRPAGRRGGHEAGTTSTRCAARTTRTTRGCSTCATSSACTSSTRPTSRATPTTSSLCHDPAYRASWLDPGRPHGRAGQEPPLRHPLVARQRVRATGERTRRWRRGSGRYDPSRPLHYEPGSPTTRVRRRAGRSGAARSPTSSARCTRGWSTSSAYAAGAGRPSADHVRVQPRHGQLQRLAGRLLGRHRRRRPGCRAGSSGSGRTTACASACPTGGSASPTAGSSATRPTTATSWPTG